MSVDSGVILMRLMLCNRRNWKTATCVSKMASSFAAEGFSSSFDYRSLFLSVFVSISLFAVVSCSPRKNFLTVSPDQSSPANSIDLSLIKKNGKWGFIDKAGQIKIAPQFDDAQNFSEDMAPVGLGERSNMKWGYIDKTGQLVIDSVFASAGPFSEGFAAVNSAGKWGYINKNGQLIIDPQYGSASDFAQGFAVVTTPITRLGPITIIESKTSIIDKQGNKLGLRITDAKPFSEGLAAVSIDQKTGFINQSGQIQIDPKFEQAESFSEELAAVANNSRWGYIDQRGNIVIDLQFEEAQSFSEGLAAVKRDGVWGYVDKSGKQVFATSFRYIGMFKEGRAKVIDNEGKSGFIDKEGNIIVSLQPYSSIEAFSRGLAMVGINGKYGYVDIYGKYVWNLTD